jgi:Fe2+ or Zn2+ uptake regulation protein
MKLYCFCQDSSKTKNFLVIDGKEQGFWNSFDTKNAKVLLRKPMEFVKAGFQQVIKHEDGTYTNHYPNVDCFVCNQCGNIIIRE